MGWFSLTVQCLLLVALTNCMVCRGKHVQFDADEWQELDQLVSDA
jgi:hypothetical protein